MNPADNPGKFIDITNAAFDSSRLTGRQRLKGYDQILTKFMAEAEDRRAWKSSDDARAKIARSFEFDIGYGWTPVPLCLREIDAATPPEFEGSLNRVVAPSNFVKDVKEFDPGKPLHVVGLLREPDELIPFRELINRMQMALRSGASELQIPFIPSEDMKVASASKLKSLAYILKTYSKNNTPLRVMMPVAEADSYHALFETIKSSMQYADFIGLDFKGVLQSERAQALLAYSQAFVEYSLENEDGRRPGLIIAPGNDATFDRVRSYSDLIADCCGEHMISPEKFRISGHANLLRNILRKPEDYAYLIPDRLGEGFFEGLEL